MKKPRLGRKPIDPKGAMKTQVGLWVPTDLFKQLAMEARRYKTTVPSIMRVKLAWPVPEAWRVLPRKDA